MNELEEILQSPQRKLIVSLSEIDLNNTDYNKLFLLLIEESLGSAGGRGGGSGHRKIDQIIGFKIYNDTVDKFFDTIEQDKIVKFEIPYSAVAMDIKLSDSKPMVIQGVVDPNLIKQYEKIVDENKIVKDEN